MRGIWLGPLLAAALAPARGGAGETPPGRWVVVTAPAFRAAVEPLAAHRKAQGFDVVVLPTTDALTPQELLGGDAGKLRDRVRRLCGEAKGPAHVLLVGSAEAGQLPGAADRVVPPLPGTVGRMKGQPSDHGYGDPGPDHVPRAAVGRLPARTVDEARDLVRRTIAYETDARP